MFIAMNDSDIKSLIDLRQMRSAPLLDEKQEKRLLNELSFYINTADWFTIGIMAPSSKQAIFVLKDMERFFNWSSMRVATTPQEDGPVFLKANQKTGDIHVRIEYGLGQGVLLGCQYNDPQKQADTLGPLPLSLFKINH